MSKIYIAAPLSTKEHKKNNEKVAKFLRFCGHEVYLPRVLRGGFAMNFSFALTLETIGGYGHSCCRSDFSLFGQVPDDEMYENKFFYAFPHQVIDVTND